MESEDDDKRVEAPDALSAPVAGRPTPSVIRVQLKCATEEEFQQRYAAQFAAPFFIAQEMRVQEGSRLRVHISIAGDKASLRGIAEVSPATRADRKGVMVKLVEVDPDGLQLRARGKATKPPTRGPAVVRRKPTTAPALPTEPAVPARPSLPDLRAPHQPNEFEDEPTRKSLLSERVAATLRIPADEVGGDEMPELPLDDGTGAAKRQSTAELEREIEPVLLTRNAPPDEIGIETPVPARPTTDPPSLPTVTAQPPPPSAKKPAPAATKQARAWKPIAAFLVVALALAIVVGFVMSGKTEQPAKPGRSTPAEPDRVAIEIAAADARIRAGELVGADSALGHLLAARDIAPDDATVQARLAALAGKFEQLADAAVAAGNHAEAAVHLRAVLQAEPDRKGVAERLAEIERQLAAAPDAG